MCIKAGEHSRSREPSEIRAMDMPNLSLINLLKIMIWQMPKYGLTE